MSTKLTARFRDALVFADQIHADQNRKLSKEETTSGLQPIPYIGHLLGVAALLINNGCSEDEVIAGLLHDAVEDRGGSEVKKVIEELFGVGVANIVQECSDTDEQPKPEWHIRKENYINHLRTATVKALNVSLADKVHNAQSILFDLQQFGPQVWKRFNATQEEVTWYYETLTTVFEDRLPDNVLTKEFRRLVEEIKS